LDVVLLNKKIYFLERGIKTLLTDPQLKGLYLAKTITKDDPNENISNLELKGKMLQHLYFNKRKKEKEQIK